MFVDILSMLPVFWDARYQRGLGGRACERNISHNAYTRMVWRLNVSVDVFYTSTHRGMFSDRSDILFVHLGSSSWLVFLRLPLSAPHVKLFERSTVVRMVFLYPLQRCRPLPETQKQIERKHFQNCRAATYEVNVLICFTIVKTYRIAGRKVVAVHINFTAREMAIKWRTWRPQNQRTQEKVRTGGNRQNKLEW